MPIQIMLAEDHKILLEGMRTLLEKEAASFTVVGCASNGREAVSMARQLKPEVVVMDIRMPDMNGIEATRQILAENKKIRVLALSMHADRQYVVEMFRAGALGYLLKDCACDELFQAIRAVTAGNMYLSPKIATGIMRDYLKSLPTQDESVYQVLSPREREVLQLLAEGRGNRDIAESLSLSQKTVETHRTQIMRKLNIHNLPELTKYAIREGLTSVEF